MTFTPTEQRILDLLADGKPHRRDELHKCINDELASFQVVRTHLYNLRKKLELRGETIVCQIRGYKIFYRHFKFLNKPD